MGYGGSELGVLVWWPLNNFNKALELLNKHRTKQYHLLAVTKADEFLSVMQGAQPSISQRLNQALADTIAKNRSILMSIVATVILCGRQNLALRGHQDSFTEVEGDECSITNH